MKRILVWAYFTMNTGDDLFLKVLFDRYPNVNWDLLTANRNYKVVFSDYKNVNIVYTYRSVNIGKYEINPFFKMNDIFLNYRKYDALVYIGGSIFKQNKAWEYRFIEREYLLTTFKRLNKKVFIIGANFGPFENEKFIEKYRTIFEQYDDICFRDTYSYNLFNHLNNVRIAPDAVLSLDINSISSKEKCVGFSVINIKNREGLSKYYDDYNEKMKQLINIYLGMGYKVKLFSFCEYEGDLEICHDLLMNIDDEFRKEIKIVHYNGKLNPFLEDFKTCEIIIGARFHSVILAFLYNQSVYPIIYSEKTYNVLKDLNLHMHLCMIKDIDKLTVDKVLENAGLNRINNKTVFKEAHKQFEKLDMFIDNSQIDLKLFDDTANKLCIGNEVIK